MASIPCTAGSSWQRINFRRGRGEAAPARRNTESGHAHYSEQLAHIVARSVRDGGGTISFEWPRH
eukprot:9532281-Heterocapsa_arctica.AAC.1